MKTNRNYRGFTLIEMVVVIAMIGVLAGLLLSAIQAARGAARRAVNKNRLKQIGVALHNYHSFHSTLPPGWIGVDSAGRPDVHKGNGFGWAAMILPMLEQSQTYERLDFHTPVDSPANAVGRSTHLPLFRSPSDIGPDFWTIRGEDDSSLKVTLPTANYVGSFGTTELHECEGLPPGVTCEGNGVFFHNSRIRFADIRDGTSHTFMVGERKTDARRGWYSTWIGAVPGGAEAFARILGVADHLPNAPVHHFDDFSSYDTGGVHFLLADGSVLFLNDHMDVRVYDGLATRAGGEVVVGGF